MISSNIAASGDPSLNVGEATGVLLAVSMELVIRMRRFSEYPIAVIRMSKTWFREEGCTAVDNVHAFLQVDVRQLDVGLSLQLRELAFAQGDGTEIAAASWLLSPPVQEMIDTIAKTVLANLLDVERRHAQAKQLENKNTKLYIAALNLVKSLLFSDFQFYFIMSVLTLYSNKPSHKSIILHSTLTEPGRESHTSCTR